MISRIAADARSPSSPNSSIPAVTNLSFKDGVRIPREALFQARLDMQSKRHQPLLLPRSNDPRPRAA